LIFTSLPIELLCHVSSLNVKQQRFTLSEGADDVIIFPRPEGALICAIKSHFFIF
jgi:hypothetical protein